MTKVLNYIEMYNFLKKLVPPTLRSAGHVLYLVVGSSYMGIYNCQLSTLIKTCAAYHM